LLYFPGEISPTNLFVMADRDVAQGQSSNSNSKVDRSLDKRHVKYNATEKLRRGALSK
jgi:hypothetical protein